VHVIQVHRLCCFVAERLRVKPGLAAQRGELRPVQGVPVVVTVSGAGGVVAERRGKVPAGKTKNKKTKKTKKKKKSLRQADHAMRQTGGLLV
jgi:hypothetical protein